MLSVSTRTTSRLIKRKMSFSIVVSLLFVWSNKQQTFIPYSFFKFQDVNDTLENYEQNYLNDSNKDLETVIVLIEAFTAIVAVFGLFGNTFIVMTTSRLKNQTSGTIFMKYLAMTDVCVITCVSVPSFAALIGRKVLRANNYTCKIGRFISWAVVFWGK